MEQADELRKMATVRGATCGDSVLVKKKNDDEQ